MKLLDDMKAKIKFAVETLYGFDTSRDSESISRNASHAQALLAKATFIYRVYLIVLQLYPTEHSRMGYRSLILAGAHVIHIDTP